MSTTITSTDRAASWLRSRHQSAWRAPIAAACLVTAAAHIPVTGEHLEEAPYIGILFIVLEIAAVALAVPLLRRPPRAVLLAIALVGALAVLALVISRTIGLPLIGDDIGNWTEPLAVVSVVAESVMVVGGLVAALGHVEATGRAVLGGVVAGALLLVVGSAATGIAAVAQASEEAADSHGTTSQHMDGDMLGMHMGLPASQLAR